VNAVYSHLAKTYDREFRDNMQYTAYLKVPQLVINELGRRQATILDVGCGTGLSSLLFFEKGYDVTGIDGTSAMIRRARKLPYKKIIQQDLESRKSLCERTIRLHAYRRTSPMMVRTERARKEFPVSTSYRSTA
jgi:predicted TPR repeat methyltransferase